MRILIRLFISWMLVFIAIPISAMNLEQIVENNANAQEAMAYVVSGPIEVGDGEKFYEFVKQNPDPSRVILDSPGGALIEGIKIGMIIRELGLNTEVGRLVYSEGVPEFSPGLCASACAIAFLGGVERSINNSKLGFHQFYKNLSLDQLIQEAENPNKVSGQAQLVSAVLSTYIQNLGDVDVEILVHAASTPPDQMFWIDEKMSVDLGIVTVGDPWTEIWIEPYKQGIVAATRREKSGTGYEGRSAYNTVGQATFFCRDSKYFVMLSAAYKMLPLNKQALQVKVAFEDDRQILEEFELNQNVTMRGSENSGWTDIELPKDLAFKVAQSNYFSIFVPLPRVTGGPQYFELTPSEMDKKKINVAYKNCI